MKSDWPIIAYKKIERSKRNCIEPSLYSLLLLFFIGSAIYCVYVAGTSEDRVIVFAAVVLAAMWTRGIVICLEVLRGDG